MRIRTGCDIVHVPRFRDSLKRTPGLQERIFTTHERSGASVQTLAGLFAAKEAAFKALGIETGQWQAVEIRKAADGRPVLHVASERPDVASCDVSISHDGDYVFAVAVCMMT